MTGSGTAESITDGTAAFCQLAARKGKECDGQPPQHARVQVDEPGKVNVGCQGGMTPMPH
jgi:hypothetical protein